MSIHTTWVATERTAATLATPGTHIGDDIVGADTATGGTSYAFVLACGVDRVVLEGPPASLRALVAHLSDLVDALPAGDA